MAENCIFCGKTLSFWTSSPLTYGGVEQPACSECAEQYGREPMLQRVRLALDTGRAKEPEKLTNFLKIQTKRQEEREKWRERASRCPACGGEMELKLEDLSVGADGRGGLASLLMDQYEVDLYACPVCGKVELYTAGFFREERPEPREELVACPVCGTKHSPSMGCPTCAVRTAQSGRRPQPPQTQEEPKPFKPSRSGKKPPWEK